MIAARKWYHQWRRRWRSEWRWVALWTLGILAATNVQVRRALAAGADAALRRDASLPRLHATVARFNSGARKEVPDAGDGQPPGEEAYGNSA